MTAPGLRLPRWLAVAALPLLAAVPEVARACSVCTAGRDDETRLAFLLTAAFLSVLPPAMIGGLAWWLRRLIRRSQQAESEAPGTPGASLASPPWRSAREASGRPAR